MGVDQKELNVRIALNLVLPGNHCRKRIRIKQHESTAEDDMTGHARAIRERVGTRDEGGRGDKEIRRQHN